MVRSAITTASLLLLGACATAEAGAGTATSAATPVATALPKLPAPKVVATKVLPACFDAQAKLAPFSGVVLVQNGNQSFYRAVGFKDADQKVPMTRDTRFRLGSVSKEFTRAGIAQLVQRGKVDVAATVGTYVPGLPAEIAAVTIDQLLNHRSGVAPLARLRPEAAEIQRNAKRASDMLPVIVGQPLSFKPGTDEQYSNGGYLLLGIVIEYVSGKTYENFLQEDVFRPLGMTSTVFEIDDRTAASMTLRLPNGDRLEKPRAHTPMVNRGNAAGDLISTADDMAKFGRALVGDRFVSPAVRKQVFTGFKENGFWRIGQAGGNIGVNTEFAAYPETGWVVTVLSNFDIPYAMLVGKALRDTLTGRGCTTTTEEQYRAKMPVRYNQVSAPPKDSAPKEKTSQ